MKTFEDFLKDDEVNSGSGGRDFEELKFSKNETHRVMVLSKFHATPEEVENGVGAAYFREYKPPYVSGGWKMQVGDQTKWFVSLPELDEDKQTEQYPEMDFVQVGQLLGLDLKPRYMMWVSDAESEEIEPMLYQPPKTVAEAIYEFEKQMDNNDLRGVVLTIKRKDNGNMTEYSVMPEFASMNVSKELREEIDAIEFPVKYSDLITKDNTEKQIEFVMEIRPIIERMLEQKGMEFPFDDEGNLKS